MITYEERQRVYTNALIANGEQRQIVKCLEELAECQQVICKVVFGEDSFDHLAEEIADARICLEQMIYFSVWVKMLTAGWTARSCGWIRS